LEVSANSVKSVFRRELRYDIEDMFPTRLRFMRQEAEELHACATCSIVVEGGRELRHAPREAGEEEVVELWSIIPPQTDLVIWSCLPLPKADTAINIGAANRSKDLITDSLQDLSRAFVNGVPRRL